MRALVAIDVRSLALYRMVTGVLVVWDLLLRARNLTWHYTDQGPIPREVARLLVSRYSVSCFQLGDGPGLAAVIFLLTGLAALGFALGYRTRLSNLVLWMGLVSIHNRNPAVLDMGDSLLVMGLFWSLFLPVGACWSLDSLGRGAPAEKSVANLATFALIFQLGLVYFCTGVQKNGPDWLESFTAVYVAIANPIHSGFLAEFWMAVMAAHPWICYLSTGLVLIWEYLLIFALFSPWRRAALASVVLFHLGLLTTMFLNLIPLINIALVLGCLPPGFWERPAAAVFSTRLDRLWGVPAQTVTLGPLAIWERGLLALALIWVVLFAVASLTGFRIYPRTVARVAASLRLNNGWQMFGPGPPIHGGYYHARGTLTDGRSVDLWNGELTFQFQEFQPRLFEWRWMALCFRCYGGKRGTQAPVCEFLARRWAKEHPLDRLRTVELIYYAAKLTPFEIGEPEAMPVYTYEVQVR